MVHVKMKQLWLCVLYCLAFVPIVLSQLCASLSFFSVWLFVLISYSSLFLSVPSSSPQLLLASKWKVLYEHIPIHFPNLTQSCVVLSHRDSESWKCYAPIHFSIFHHVPQMLDQIGIVNYGGGESVKWKSVIFHFSKRNGSGDDGRPGDHMLYQLSFWGVLAIHFRIIFVHYILEL